MTAYLQSIYVSIFCALRHLWTLGKIMNVPLSRDWGCQHVNIPLVQRRFINNIIITTSRLSPSLQVAACGWGRMGDFIRVIQHKRCFGHLKIQFLHSQTERRMRRPPCITLPGNTGLYLVHLARTWRTLGSRLSIHRLTGQHWQMQRFMANVWRP